MPDGIEIANRDFAQDFAAEIARPAGPGGMSRGGGSWRTNEPLHTA